MNKLLSVFDLVFVKAVPNLSKSTKDFFVTVAPIESFLSIIFSLLLLSGLFWNAPFGNTTFLGISYHTVFNINAVISILFVILNIVAIPYLLKRKPLGWYILLVTMILASITYLTESDFIFIFIRIVIALYIIFQIRSYYFKK